MLEPSPTTEKRVRKRHKGRATLWGTVCAVTLVFILIIALAAGIGYTANGGGGTDDDDDSSSSSSSVVPTPAPPILASGSHGKVLLSRPHHLEYAVRNNRRSRDTHKRK